MPRSTQARRRNLLLSFGILGVLVASVGLIVVNARRSERLAAQQMDFVATVSHELRTPLAVIRSAAQNLSAGVVHDAAAGAALRRSHRRRRPAPHGHGRAGARVRRAQRQPASGRWRGRSTSAPSYTTSCRRLRACSRPRASTVDVDVPADLPPVVADEGAIRRALHNLVTNALKYARRRPLAGHLGTRHDLARRAGSADRGERSRPRHRGRRSGAHLRAVLPRTVRDRSADSRQRPRPEPRASGLPRRTAAASPWRRQPARDRRSRCTCRPSPPQSAASGLTTAAHGSGWLHPRDRPRHASASCSSKTSRASCSR